MRTQPGRAHVASMPDTTWPISGHPPGSSRDRIHTPVLMPTVPISTLQRQRRTSSQPLPDASKCAFSQLAHHDRLQLTQQWVVWSLPPQGDSGGPTPISRAASHQEALPISSSLPRSGRNRAKRREAGLGRRAASTEGDIPATHGDSRRRRAPPDVVRRMRCGTGDVAAGQDAQQQC